MYKITEEDYRYYVTDIQSHKHSLDLNASSYSQEIMHILKATQLATYYVANPIIRADSVRSLIHVSLSDETYHLNSSELQDTVEACKTLLSKSENNLNRVNTGHTELLLSRFDKFNAHMTREHCYIAIHSPTMQVTHI